jgi:DNA-binding LacI/PurR family transcriptional regulator
VSYHLFAIMGIMAVTIAHVARAARVSAATVCRVLNQHPEVSERMRRKVLTALRRIGWPTRALNTSHRVMRPAGTGHGATVIDLVLHRFQRTEPVAADARGPVIGALRPPPPGFFRDRAYRLESGFYRGLIDGALEEAGPWGYQLVIQQVRDLRDEGLLASLGRAGKAGVILAGDWHPDLEHFAAACPKPLVLLDLPAAGSAPVVTMDDQVGIGAAMDHLLALGHRRIAFAGGTGDGRPMQRFVAWRMHLADAGLPLRHAWVYQDSVHMVDVQRWAGQLLALPERPTAVVCQNDFVAIAVIMAARSCGLAVPEALSVVGYDDGEMARLMVPALTTVTVPTGALGRIAVRELLQEVSDAADAPRLARRVLVAPALTVRGSTASALPG